MMNDFRKMGPKRPTKVIYIIAAVIIAVIVILFVGMNLSHRQDMGESREQGLSPDAPATQPATPPGP